MKVQVAAVLSLVLFTGCAQKKLVTIATEPPDATIRVDGIEQGRAPVTKTIVFKDQRDAHRVTAQRKGYKPRDVVLARDSTGRRVDIPLRPLTRVVNVIVDPVPAMVRINGKPVSPDPVSTVSRELEFTVSSPQSDDWTKYTITAERDGFQPAQTTVSWPDQSPSYVLNLLPLKKDITIKTDPPGAQVSIDDEPLGASPVTDVGRAFPFDTSTNQFVPHKVTASMPGYDPVSVNIGWDEGRKDYNVDLVPKTKQVRIVTDPPQADVKIDGVGDIKRDALGEVVTQLSFPPVDAKGNLKAYTVHVAKQQTNDSEWYPADAVVGWDNGKTDYTIKLKEVLTRPVSLLTLAMVRGENGAWDAVPKRVDTIAMKDAGEGENKEPPTRVTPQLPGGTSIDTFAISPDGKRLLFTTLLGRDKSDFRSQLTIINTDGSGGTDLVTDGKSLDVTPSFSPGGDQILFASNRAGRHLAVWSMSANGAGGMTSLTNDDGHDIWPCLDSDPKPRLFYQVMFDTRPDPRLFSTQVGTNIRRDLTPAGGFQPRINPKNDSIVFTIVNEKTGKRDIARMSDKGGLPENLTNTPDVDEFDPSWSSDGDRIAFASDRGIDQDGRHNLDIWVMDLSNPSQPTQVTINGSVDDGPQWDPAGNAIYFRSNRGGQWGIWRIGLK